jgi:hypothetical protein
MLAVQCLIIFSEPFDAMGFGDVTPVHPIARTLTNVEAIIGQLFPATLLARLITLELRGYRQRS